jgi:hypothetical protein
MTSADEALRLYMRLCSSSMRLGCTNAVSKTCAEAFKESMTSAEEMLNAYTCYALASALHIDTQSARTMPSQGLVDTSIRRPLLGGGDRTHGRPTCSRGCQHCWGHHLTTHGHDEAHDE